MARFLTNYNNGTVAWIREDHAILYGQITLAKGDPTKAGVRIFTFSDSEGYRGIVTGTHKDAEFLMSGHEIVPAVDLGRNCGWGGYVPFSNGIAIAERELEYVTTLSDVIEVILKTAANAQVEKTTQELNEPVYQAR